VEHELLGRERNEGTGALIARRRSTEDDWRECGKGASIGRRRPRNEIFYILTARRRQNGEEQRCGRLASVARRGDNTQRPLSDPAAAAFVSKRRAPTSATNDFSCGTPAVGDRPSSND